MHQTVLQRHVRDLRGSLLQNFVDDRARAPVVGLDLTFGRPIRRLVLGSFSNGRIDAEFEQMVELRMEAWYVQGVAADLIPVECFQVAQVENEPMPLRDGPRIQDSRPQELK